MGSFSSEGRVPECRMEDPEAVVNEGAEAVGEGAGLLDDQVDRFGAAVGDPTGVEVGQDLRSPGPQCPAEAADLADRARSATTRSPARLGTAWRRVWVRGSASTDRAYGRSPANHPPVAARLRGRTRRGPGHGSSPLFLMPISLAALTLAGGRFRPTFAMPVRQRPRTLAAALAWHAPGRCGRFRCRCWRGRRPARQRWHRPRWLR